jgi:hypothetical protein
MRDELINIVAGAEGWKTASFVLIMVLVKPGWFVKPFTMLRKPRPFYNQTLTCPRRQLPAFRKGNFQFSAAPSMYPSCLWDDDIYYFKIDMQNVIYCIYEVVQDYLCMLIVQTAFGLRHRQSIVQYIGLERDSGKQFKIDGMKCCLTDHEFPFVLP